MKTNAQIEVRRCRPLLGTLVEIAAAGRSEVRLERAIDMAFKDVAKVHRLMSYYDPQSDVSHMNREAFPKSVIVHPWSSRVRNSLLVIATEHLASRLPQFWPAGDIFLVSAIEQMPPQHGTTFSFT